MITIGVDLKGLDDLQRQIDDIGNRALSQEVMREAMMEAAQPLAVLAASRVTRGVWPPQPGRRAQRKYHLADTMRVGHPRYDVERGTRKRMPKGTLVVVGSSSRRARFEEFGTWRTPARPFLRPAVEQDREALIERFASILRRIIAERF